MGFLLDTLFKMSFALAVSLAVYLIAALTLGGGFWSILFGVAAYGAAHEAVTFP